MDPLTVVLLIVALAVGVALGWWICAARTAGAIARAQAEAASARDERERQYELYRETIDHTRDLQSASSERSQQHAAVLTALAPVADTLQQLQRKIGHIEGDRQTQFGELSEQLRRAQESDDALRATTATLAGALRSTATRGVWGEAQLRRVVEAAGLVRHVDFDLQTHISTENGTGRPDLVIRLAGGSAIAVDAKVPLDSYLEASALPADDPRHGELLSKHVKALRAHIDALTKKAYWDGLDASPEFVICFLPTESLLAVALDADATVLDYAFTRKVALATPVNLWAVLKTVAHAWNQQEVSEEAHRLISLGKELYSRLGVLAGHAETLRKGLQRAVDGYNSFAGSLESRVLVTARQFPQMDAAIAAAPGLITTAPRPLTAPEFVDDVTSAVPNSNSGYAERDTPHRDIAAEVRGADLGDVRYRIESD